MNVEYEFNYMLRFSRVTDTVYGNKNERNYGKNIKNQYNNTEY